MQNKKVTLKSEVNLVIMKNIDYLFLSNSSK